MFVINVIAIYWLFCFELEYNCSQFKEDVERMFFRIHFHQMPVESQEYREKAKEIAHQIALKGY